MNRIVLGAIALWLLMFQSVSAQSVAFGGDYVGTTARNNACSASNVWTTGTGASCQSSASAFWWTMAGLTSPNTAILWSCGGENTYSSGCGTTQAYAAGNGGAFPPFVGTWFRTVTVCPVGYIENSTTHKCEAPPDCVAGGDLQVAIAVMPSPFYQPPALTCGTQVSGQCQLDYVGGFFVEDDFHAAYRYSGELCNGEEEEPVFTALDPSGVPGCTEVYDSLLICEPEEGTLECYESGSLDPAQCPSTVVGNSPTPEDVCGFVAGDYRCMSSTDQYCGMVEGEVVCLPRGDIGAGITPISEISPDHPINGGNGNGDDTDDIFVDSGEVGTAGIAPDDIKRVVQEQRTRNLVDTLDGVGDGESGGLDCDANPGILACEVVPTGVISDGESALSDFEGATGDLGIKVQSYIDIVADYNLGDGPDFGPYYSSCPLMGIAGFPEEVDVSLICEITGGPVKMLIELMGLIMAAILLIKGVSL